MKYKTIMFKNFLLYISKNMYKFSAMIKFLMTRTIMAKNWQIFLAVFCVYCFSIFMLSCSQSYIGGFCMNHSWSGSTKPL